MKQNKVMTVFNGNEMQKYFLLLTKQAEEAAYQAMIESTDIEMQLHEFLNEIKEKPVLKQMIQDMVLVSISNVNWQESLEMVRTRNRQIG